MSSCLNSESLQKFDNIVGHRKPMRRGERLFMAGENIKSMFILHSGSVKSYIESADGTHQITGFHFPGDVIGLHGLDEHVHTDTVQTLETSSVCEIQFRDFNLIVKTFPKLQSEFMRHVLRELDHEQLMLLVLGKMTAEQRIAHFLMDISSRFENRGLSADRINLSMTRDEIANYLGLAVETVSRVLSKLQRLRIIDVERKFILIRNFNILNNIPNKLEHRFDSTSH